MDGYNITSVISSVLLHMLNIVVLFVVLRALVYRPVRKFLQARTDRIEAERQQAEKERAEAENLHAQYTLELSRAHDDANQQAEELLVRANEAAHTITAQTEAESKKILARAKLQAQHVHEDAIRQLKRDAADIAVEISARVLAREISPEDNAKIIESYFAAIEQQSPDSQAGSGARS